MVELKELSEAELTELMVRGGRMHRGRVSYPILQMFIESESKASVVDIDHPNPQTLAQVLRSYVKNHKLPVKVVVRNQKIILVKIPDEEVEESKKTDAPIDITSDSDNTDDIIEEQGEMKFKKKVT